MALLNFYVEITLGMVKEDIFQDGRHFPAKLYFHSLNNLRQLFHSRDHILHGYHIHFG